MKPAHDPTEPMGNDGLEQISEVVRLREDRVIKGILVRVPHAQAVLRVYMALQEPGKFALLALDVAHAIAYSEATLQRAQARANRRGSLLGRFRG